MNVVRLPSLLPALLTALLPVVAEARSPASPDRGGADARAPLRLSQRHYDFTQDPPAEGDRADDGKIKPMEPTPDDRQASRGEQEEDWLILGATGGYAFRLSPDQRNHGGAAFIFTDLFLSELLGLRVEGGAFGFPESVVVDGPLAIPTLSTSLVFGGWDRWLVSGIGMFLASPLEVGADGSPAPLLGGLLLSVDVMLPIFDPLAWVVSVRSPLALFSTHDGPIPSRLTLAVTTGIALSL